MNELQAYKDLSIFLDAINVTAYAFIIFFITLFVTFILIITPILAFRVTVTNAIEQAKKSDDSSLYYAYAKASAISIIVFLCSTYIIEFIFVTVFGIWGSIGEVINVIFFLGF